MPDTLPFEHNPIERHPEQAEPEAPFLIEHHRRDGTPDGSYRPATRLVITKALRTSGLWTALPPEEFKNFFLLLTFLTPNGWCQPALPELAHAMQVSPAKARSRLLRLAHLEWQGHPVVTELPRPDGLDAYAPGRHLFASCQMSPPEPFAAPLPPVAGREAVITHSRKKYAHTREQVEQDIAERMGWTPPAFADDDPAVAGAKRQAYERLTNLGLPKEQVVDLLARFDTDRIERQIKWLPHRNAKNQARYLVAAIENEYDEPLSLRAQPTRATSPENQSTSNH